MIWNKTGVNWFGSLSLLKIVYSAKGFKMSENQDPQKKEIIAQYIDESLKEVFAAYSDDSLPPEVVDLLSVLKAQDQELDEK